MRVTATGGSTGPGPADTKGRGGVASSSFSNSKTRRDFGELERRRAQLRNEIGRLAETFEAERRVNAAIGEAHAAAAAEVAEKARGRLAARRVEEVKQAAAEQLKPWGCEVKRDERKTR